MSIGGRAIGSNGIRPVSGAVLPTVAQTAAMALLGIALAMPASAGPTLPVVELDLQVLDLNGAPFRHFHLGHFAGVTLDPSAVPLPPPPSPNAFLNDVRQLRNLPQVAGVSMPEDRYQAAAIPTDSLLKNWDEELLQRDSPLPW